MFYNPKIYDDFKGVEYYTPFLTYKCQNNHLHLHFSECHSCFSVVITLALKAEPLTGTCTGEKLLFRGNHSFYNSLNCPHIKSSLSSLYDMLSYNCYLIHSSYLIINELNNKTKVSFSHLDYTWTLVQFSTMLGLIHVQKSSP